MRLKELLKSAKDSDQPKRRPGRPKESLKNRKTDINIGVTMLSGAIKNTFDKALLFSGDSDMIAVVRAIKMIVPNKHIKVIIPFGRSCKDLAKQCHSKAKLKIAYLANNQFANTIVLSNGNQINKPAKWI